jgi:hypothetical protein
VAEFWTTTQAAEYCGITSAAFRRERSRDYPPPEPVGRQPGRKGQDLYDADAVRAWRANRPGRGFRSDLKEMQ